MTLLRWSCLLYREKRGDRRSERRICDVQREKERERDHWSATAHAVKRAIKRDATQPRPRSSPNLGCRSCRRTSHWEREREREIAAINRKCVTSSIALSFSLFIFLSLSLSLSRQRTPRRSVNQVENPQESVLNSRWSLSIRRGVVLSDLLPNKNVITAYAIAIYVENCCRAIDQSAWNYKSLILDSNKWISTMIEVLFDDDECKEIYFLHYLTALRFNHFDWKVLIEIVTII